MESFAILPFNLESQTAELEKTSSKILLNAIFADKYIPYLNELTLYLAHFNTIPNYITEIEIDCKKANQWFVQAFNSEIKDFHYSKNYNKENETAELDDIFYFLFDDLLVDFATNRSFVRFLFRKTEKEKVENVITGIKKFKKNPKRKPEISLLVATYTGIEIKKLQITKPKLSIEDNYNDDFKSIHQTIFKRLSKKSDKGLVLLHGKPGTGKTSYIRYLICSLKKNVIFLPPNMARVITNPDLISILIDNPNCILIIEDAENIVIDRDKEGNSPVSALLNISDGLLSDFLNIQIICSFNTDITKVDSALMRKGRLIAKYEFKELEVEKAQELSNKLCFNTIIDKPMTLTEIYNQDEIQFVQSKKNNPVGFKVTG